MPKNCLTMFKAEGDGFLRRVVTGNKYWVHYFQSKTERARKEWRQSSTLNLKKFPIISSAGKLMPMLFLDYEGPVLERYVPRGVTINRETYCNLLENHSKLAVRSERHSLFCYSVLIKRDNARSRIAYATAQQITKLRFCSVFHILYINPTLHHVIIICLGRSRSFHCTEARFAS